MEVHLSAELEAKLTRVAAERGRSAETLVEEAVERLVDHEAWFIREVQKGEAAADRGEFVEHRDIRDLIDRRYPD